MLSPVRWTASFSRYYRFAKMASDHSSKVLVGVIGGSGLYHLDNLTVVSVALYVFLHPFADSDITPANTSTQKQRVPSST